MICYGYGILFTTYMQSILFYMTVSMLAMFKLDLNRIVLYTRRKILYKSYGIGIFRNILDYITVVGIGLQTVDLISKCDKYYFNTSMFGNSVLATAFVVALMENVLIWIGMGFEKGCGDKPPWVKKLESKNAILSQDLDLRGEIFRNRGKIKFVENNIKNLKNMYNEEKTIANQRLTA
jgi:hypothetical protein